jgi:hypothetical protein
MNQMPFDHNQKLLAAIQPSMRYDEKEDFKSWQARADEKLKELLGLPYEKCEDRMVI